MCLLVISLLLIPMLKTGNINESFIKVTAGFVASIFSSTFILFLLSAFIILLNFIF